MTIGELIKILNTEVENNPDMEEAKVVMVGYDCYGERLYDIDVKDMMKDLDENNFPVYRLWDF